MFVAHLGLHFVVVFVLDFLHLSFGPIVCILVAAATTNGTSTNTFDSWFSKNKSYFEEEGKALPESSKVRLLLSKLGSEEYARIERKMLPTKLSEMKFWDLVSELKKEFGDPKSQLVKRYEALNLKCQGLEDVIEFGSRVNAQCEKAQMALSIEEIKILIYISGLPSEEQSLRQLAMRFVENKKKQALPVSLKEVIEECRLHLANKAEAVLIAEKPTLVKEHAVKVNVVKADNEQPPKEVKEKEEKWKPERQWLHKQMQCEFCGKKGHVKQDCWHYKSPYCGVGEVCDPSDPSSFPRAHTEHSLNSQTQQYLEGHYT
uniref:CCHC-type domain-containing protein n=1 Tax=Meloidogyne incognita TaxID=6306 RepID=A0A914KTS2_MELIC